MELDNSKSHNSQKTKMNNTARTKFMSKVNFDII